MKRSLFFAIGLAATVSQASFAQTPTPDQLAQRTIERRAVEAVIWGMPAVNTDLMYQAMVKRPIDGVDQSNFFTGKTEKSARDGILIWCADRLQAVKWKNFEVHFYQQETMVSPPVKLAIPLLFNLYTNPREDQDKVITDSWIFGPVLKMVGEFEASVKKHPLIAMGTPDPYVPPN